MSSVRTIRQIAQLLGSVVCLMLALQGCEVAQDRVYILTEPTADTAALSLGPTQANLIDALQDFSEDHDFQCRQHVKRWDEWSCAGPHSMRITFEPDRGKNRFVAEFTLVILSDDYPNDFRKFVNEFVEYMNTKFAGAVIHAAERP